MTDTKQAQMKRKHTERNSYNNISKLAKKQHFDQPTELTAGHTMIQLLYTRV